MYMHINLYICINIYVYTHTGASARIPHGCVENDQPAHRMVKASLESRPVSAVSPTQARQNHASVGGMHWPLCVCERMRLCVWCVCGVCVCMTHM